MSLKQQILDWFLGNPDKKTDNATLREEIDNDDAQQVSVCLNALFNDVGLKREKVEGERGFRYWMPLATAAEIQADSIIKRGRAPAAAKPKKERKAKKAKAERATKKAKRKYTRRAPPQSRQAETPAHSPAASLEAAKAVFAIRQDGELGIDNDGKAVSLPRAEVQRLRVFLETVSPLWS